jgi:two-component system sensor histidine kinase KdpD
MAQNLGVNWLAFHIDGGVPKASDDTKRLEANLQYAKMLGADISTFAGADVPKTLVMAACRSGVTMLVIGRSGLSRSGVFHVKSTISDRILREAKDLDIVIISDAPESMRKTSLGALLSLFSSPFRQYLAMALVFISVTIVCLALMPVIGNRGVELLYLAAILVLSLFSRPAPIVLLAGISSLAYNFFFIEPRFTFAIASVGDILVFILYFLVAAVTGFLSSGLRLREALLLKRDRVASLLLSAGEHFSGIRLESAAAGKAAMLVERYTGSPAVVCIRGLANHVESFHTKGIESIDTIDIEAAKQCLVLEEPCGAGSRILYEAGFRFVPAKTGNGVLASIGFKVGNRKGRYVEDDSLFEALGKSLALTIEKVRSEEASRKALLELESERLAKVLFDSVSHELRTPLTTITGSLCALKDNEIDNNPSARSELLEGALASAENLNRVVEDFLSISRMESGRLKLKLEPIDASYIVTAISSGVMNSLEGRQLKIRLPESRNEYRLDAALVIRLGINLIDNACRYSRTGGTIELILTSWNDDFCLTVKDEGPGFSDARMKDPFVKFRRSEGDKPGKLGLGLAMCKGIADAHNGHIEAKKSAEGFEVEAVFPGCRVVEAKEKK